jgi:hypothetical protein
MSEEHGNGENEDAAPLEAKGVEPDLTTDDFTADGLVEDIKVPGWVVEDLDIIAGRILGLLDKREPADRRLAAALLLKQAKQRIEARVEPRFRSFKVWWTEKLPGHGERDIRALLKIANAPDPGAAIEAARAKNAEKTRQYRKRKVATSESASDSTQSQTVSVSGASQSASESSDAKAPESHSTGDSADPDQELVQDLLKVYLTTYFEPGLEFLRQQEDRPIEIRMALAHAITQRVHAALNVRSSSQ